MRAYGVRALTAASVLFVLVLATNSLAQHPQPPAPNPDNPVDYIKWINETFGAGLGRGSEDVGAGLASLLACAVPLAITRFVTSDTQETICAMKESS